MSEQENQKSKPDEVSRDTLIQKKKLFYKSSKKQRTLNDHDIESITIQIRGSGSELLRSPGHLHRIYTDTDFGDIVWDFDMDPTDPVKHTDSDPDDPTDVIHR